MFESFQERKFCKFINTCQHKRRFKTLHTCQCDGDTIFILTDLTKLSLTLHTASQSGIGPGEEEQRIEPTG